MGIHPFNEKWPQIPATCFVAPGAQVVGDVVLGDEASIWFNAVLRGDVNAIRIGARTTIQDGVIVHVDPGPYQAVVGEGCVVGHAAVVHGCTIGNNCLIGMGAIVLNGARIGEGSVVAAGALVPEHKEFPPRSLLMGTPARVVRELSEAESIEMVTYGVNHYRALAQSYAKERNDANHGDQNG